MIKLTQEQQKAVDECVDWIINPKPEKKFFCIKGCAGTGKTSLVPFILKALFELHRYVNPCIAALSRKAVGVLGKKLGDTASRETLYSLCGAKGRDGDEKFAVDFGKNKFKNYNLFFIDECSMLSKKHKECIDKIIAEYPSKKIIFLGDIAQLAPVGEKNKSCIFDSSDIQYATLTERLRQGEGSSILEYADIYREVSLGNKTSFETFDEIDTNELSFVDFEENYYKFCDKFKNGENIKIVTSENKMVNSYNKRINYQLFGTEEIVPGCKIIFNEQYTHTKCVIDNSEEGVVLKKYSNVCDGIRFWNYYVDIDGVQYKNINVIADASSEERYRKLLSEKLRRAKSNERYSPNYKEDWRDYWAFEGKFAKIDLSYAITAHKSQGSTYDEVIIDRDTIMNSPVWTDVQKAELMYTAITRASKHVYTLV